MSPRLTLDRMIVFRKGVRLYDERFHRGLNVIHGDNGSGKSTLADFIFFGLGGDLREWKPYASQAEFVLLQISTGSTTICLRRDVSADSRRPMHVFFGASEDALSAGPTAWELLPYNRPEKGFSFSQVLFKAIGIPEAVGEGGNNITMHQLLRLLYVDQMTPIQRIFRSENFDQWQARQAVGDLLCGVGGYDLFDLQFQVRRLERDYEGVSVELRNLMTVATGYGDRVLAEHIVVAINETVGRRDQFLAELSGLLSGSAISEEQAEVDKRVRKETAKELADSRREVRELEERHSTLEYEIQDSDNFIDYLEKTLADFDDASATFFSLGHIHFSVCPACLTATSDSDDPAHCHLCGAEKKDEPDQSKALAVRIDLEMQLKESVSLQEGRREEFELVASKLRIARVRLRKAINANELARTGDLTQREAVVAELSRNIGFLDSELQVLQRRLELSAEIARLSDRKEKLNVELTRAKSAVDAIVSAQAKRKSRVHTFISEHAKSLLDRDLVEHSDFGVVEHVSFDFAGDWIAINGDKNRSGSASGMVVLKNSFFMGLLLSSLQDSAFNLPRWMLFDNIEDKGMVQERSWNFQMLMLEYSRASAVDHQIIYTTSKIAPDLIDSEYVVGRKYTKQRPSLWPAETP